MASFTLPTSQTPFTQKCKSSSSFLGETYHLKSTPRFHKTMHTTYSLNPISKFDLFQVLGGRGLCNGEKGLLKELSNKPTTPPSVSQTSPTEESSDGSTSLDEFQVPENAFNKELQGLTGGFPGGEIGLEAFLEKNPPPPKKSTSSGGETGKSVASAAKSKPPELPLLMPGMIAIVKNERNPFYMYCGIIQRITDGKAGVLFEGGNWDKLITFRLDELERREKGPPMVNPKSAIVEGLAQQDP